jgi:hypothetical protein
MPSSCWTSSAARRSNRESGQGRVCTEATANTFRPHVTSLSSCSSWQRVLTGSKHSAVHSRVAATRSVSVRVPTSLAGDFAPDDLVGCAPFGSPIGRKFVNHPQPRPSGWFCVAGRNTGRPRPWSSTSMRTPRASEWTVSQIVPRAWTTPLVTSSLTNSSATSMIDASTPFSARTSPVKTRALRTLAGLPGSSTALAIDFRVPRARPGYSGTHAERGCSRSWSAWRSDMRRPVLTPLRRARGKIEIGPSICAALGSSRNRRRSPTSGLEPPRAFARVAGRVRRCCGRVPQRCDGSSRTLR